MAKRRTSRRGGGRPHGGGTKRSSWYYMRVAFALLFSVVTSLAFYRLGILHRLEPGFSRLEVYFEEPNEENKVALIDITAEDYQTIFHGQSPLDPSQLSLLISAISTGRPSVIGIDIDTSAPQFKRLEVQEWWPPVVWQREVEGDPNDGAAGLALLNVLGGQDPALNANSGLALLIDTGDDNVTRQYQRMIETKEGRVASLPWAVVSKSGAEQAKQLPASTEPLVIRYTDERAAGGRYRLTAGRVLELYREKGWKENGPLRDKIVLLGGSYLVQDRHETPLGQMSGLEVMAHVIETDLHGGGHRPPGLLALTVLLTFEGFLVVFLFHHFGMVKAILTSVFALAAFSVAASLVIYHSLSHLPYFLLLLLLVVVYQAVETYRGRSMAGLYEVMNEPADGGHQGRK